MAKNLEARYTGLHNFAALGAVPVERYAVTLIDNAGAKRDVGFETYLGACMFERYINEQEKPYFFENERTDNDYSKWIRRAIFGIQFIEQNQDLVNDFWTGVPVKAPDRQTLKTDLDI